MTGLIILTYFVIGFVVGLFIYDYHCKDFNKKNKNRQFKLTWEEYAHKHDPGFCMAFAIILWPFFLLVGMFYYMFQYPIDCIKKYNGIK